MNSLEKLAGMFMKFPGIGPRQARRFVYFLLGENKTFRDELSRALSSLSDSIAQCASCRRFFPRPKTGTFCDICDSPHTDHRTLLIVEKDADFEAIKKTGSYNGRYFILGGNIPILEENPSQKIRARELFDEAQRQATEGTLKEIIIATSANPEGDNTLAYLKKIIEPLATHYSLSLSALGRGLSTGTELEYSDTDTFKHAFENRRG
ncbi:MAG: recombination protein RecR [Candidatus Lloydbacteria bacterium CG22_combo_CG10-13_8_21_14_all_47_15]|uniref:Recombination protein RecR n=1 Tax=Candidatus Lloydbacteria bacterium CG22_combo_CG10-13_8_21_14_all_47_15 TaxID=1974635 RepID=A0A2H0CTF5_9BACT|nr:MAG: recombination protein RecR [Candidatus Lloydbacteria bacterium CG22_combo_CG10-13_8_21_14_all_47_15]